MVSLKEIAAEAGVSVHTVSRVLNGKQKEVWPSMAQRASAIREIAERLGYRPNGAARAMRGGRFNCLALLGPTGNRSIYLPRNLLSGLQLALSEHNLHLSLGELPAEDDLTPTAAPKILRELLVDGAILNLLDHPSDAALQLERRGMPLMWVNTRRKHDCVRPDDVAAGRMATEKLLTAGHRRIGFLNLAGNHHYSSKDRREGYEQALATARISPCVLHDAAPSQDPQQMCAAVAQTQRWLKDNCLTAVVAQERYEAGIVLQAAARLGWWLPEQLSLIAVSDSAIVDCGWPVETVVLPFGRVGRLAVENLLQRIHHPKKHVPAAVVPPTVILPGASIGLPRPEPRRSRKP